MDDMLRSSTPLSLLEVQCPVVLGNFTRTVIGGTHLEMMSGPTRNTSSKTTRVVRGLLPFIDEPQ